MVLHALETSGRTVGRISTYWSAACGQAGLCASGSGGEWEQYLAARSGAQEQHGERRQDGAEALQP